MPISKNSNIVQNGFSTILLIPLILIFLAAGVVGIFILKKSQENPSLDNKTQFDLKNVTSSNGKDNPFSKRYSRGKCEGEGTTTFTHPPMKIEDIGAIEPYGIMVDAHVIPTSHGYISPVIFNSERDAYPVYAIADGTIVHISHRGQFIGDYQQDRPTDEYQMYIEYSCIFYSYYDLLTSIAPEIEKEVGKLTGFDQKHVRIPVKAGQLVGRVGGQTVDFAVWNFEKEPAYFVNPESYKDDEDRFYLDDMMAYFSEPIKQQLLPKAKRIEEPRSGKVAYDIEGKLIGNWFREGSGGFMGAKDIQNVPGGRRWDGHLSIVYHYINPTKIIFSIGNFNGKAAQFTIKGNRPDPATIGIESGIVKYELLSTSANGQDGAFQGTALLQLIEPAKLKLEIFPGKTQEQVSGFTDKALIYER